MQVPDNVVSGTVSCDGTTKRLPDVPCRLVYFQASFDNAVNITIGGEEVQDGSAGLVLEPGEKTPAVLVDNLNRFYVYGQEEDSLDYVVIR